MRALLIIDIQKSYITKYETDIVQRINERIMESQKAQYDIVYIKNTKKLRSEMWIHCFYSFELCRCIQFTEI